MQSICTSLGLLLALASLSSAVRSGGFLLPKQPKLTCSADGFFPISSGACAKQYYFCQSGVAYLKNCSDGTIFDESSKQCKSPNEVNCRADTRCPTPNGDYPLADPYCGPQYYRCIEGTPSVEVCSVPGHFFDPASLRCKDNTFFDKDDCFSCQVDSGEFPFRFPSCTFKFHDCVNGKPYTKICPGNTVFDTTLKRCTPVGSTTCWGKCDPANNRTFSIAGKCSSDYIACVAGTPSIKTCPNGEFFDLESLTCKPVAEVKCVSGLCKSDGDVSIPDMSCSNQYIKCTISGTASLEKCSDPDLPIFDKTTNACVALLGSCWLCPEADGFFPLVEGRCDPNFVECVSNLGAVQTCKNTNAIFDPIVKKCTANCPINALAYWNYYV